MSRVRPGGEAEGPPPLHIHAWIRTREPVAGEVGVEEFVADGIFELQNYISRDVELKTRFIIRKLRGTDHSRRFHSVVFTPNGIEILPYTP